LFKEEVPHVVVVMGPASRQNVMPLVGLLNSISMCQKSKVLIEGDGVREDDGEERGS